MAQANKPFGTLCCRFAVMSASAGLVDVRVDRLFSFQIRTTLCSLTNMFEIDSIATLDLFDCSRDKVKRILTNLLAHGTCTILSSIIPP